MCTYAGSSKYINTLENKMKQQTLAKLEIDAFPHFVLAYRFTGIKDKFKAWASALALSKTCLLEIEISLEEKLLLKAD